MRRIALLLSLLSGVGTAHALSWTDLWLTQEQQAQHLLDSGKAADAAHKFEDPRRRAYAEIEAGKYAEAAQLLERFRDPQSQYNRGNALARAGRLENALAAYEATIKQTASDSRLGQDARRNRALVAEQLKKQQQSSQSNANNRSQADRQSSGPEQPAKQDQSQSGSQPQQSVKQNQGQSGGRSQQGQQNQQSSGQQGQSGAANKNEQRDGDQQSAGNASDQHRNQGTQASQSQQSSPGEPPKSANSQRDVGASGSERREQDAQAQRNAATSRTEQRRDDAQAQGNADASGTQQEQIAARDQRAAGDTLARPDSHTGKERNEPAAQAAPSDDRGGTSGAATQESRPSERTLALDQWLRQIPDDPAGLLRRKFLIEHLRRQGSQEELQ